MAEPLFNVTNNPLGTPNLNVANSTPKTGGGGLDPIAIAQGTAREIGAVGQSTLNKLTLGKAPNTLTPPSDPNGLALYKAIYGTDKPISTQTVGEEYPGVKPGSKIAPIVAVGGFALNAIPGASEEAKALKALARTSDAVEAGNILKRFGFSADIIDHAAPVFASLKNEDEVKSAFTGIKDLAERSKKTGLVDPATQVTEALRAEERGFTSSVKNQFPDLVKVAGQYVPRDTDALAARAKNFIRDNAAAAEQLAKTGTDENAVATAAEFIKKLTNDALSADEATKAILYDKAAEIANASAENLTGLGRAVQAASILQRLTPEGLVRFAARTIQKYNESVDAGILGTGRTLAKKIPELSGAQAGKILEKAKAIEQMSDGLEKARALKELMDDISALAPTTLWRKFITVLKAGWLTGLKTTGVNVSANSVHSILEAAKQVPAAAIDTAASVFTGERTTTATLKGRGTGFVEGAKKGYNYLKTGFDERDVATKLDYTKVNFGKGPIAKGLQTYTDAVFRLLGAEDQPFFYSARLNSLEDQALALAKTKGLSGAELAQFTKDIVQNPTTEMLQRATADASIAVFQNRTVLGDAARTIQKIPGAEFVLPFARTPSAAAMQVLNYSPVGAVKTVVETLLTKARHGTFDQRAFSQALGRGITGTGVGYLGYKLADQGVISLARPTTEAERRQWELEGRVPNSIKIGNKWRQVNVLGPAGNVLLAGAYLREAQKNGDDNLSATLSAAFGAAKSLKDQTFLKGLSDVIDAINDPQRFGRSYAQNVVGSVVPTIVSDVARGTDDVERRTSTVGSGFKSRVPGLRETLEPQIDTFGRTRKSPSFFTALLDPTRPGVTPPIDSVTNELSRLASKGYKATPTMVGDTEVKGYKVLTEQQNTDLIMHAGETLKHKLDRLIASPAYAQLSDEKKTKTINDFADRAKVDARARIILEITHGLTGPALKAELSRLKKGKVMSEDVYNRFIELR